MTFASCNGAKAYVKKARKMEEAGMNEQAAAHYMTALRKKPDNLDALTGLKRTGQIVLAQHFATFDEALIRNEREAAIAWCLRFVPAIIHRFETNAHGM